MKKTLGLMSMLLVLSLVGCRSRQGASSDLGAGRPSGVNKTKVAQITARAPVAVKAVDFIVAVAPEVTDPALRDALAKYVGNALTYKGMTPATTAAEADLTVKVNLDVQSQRRTKFIVTQQAYDQSGTLCWSIMSSCTTSLYEQPLHYLPGLISAGIPFIGVNKTGPVNVYRSPEDLKAVLR